MANYDIVTVTDVSIIIVDRDVGRRVTHDANWLIHNLNQQIPGGIGRRNVYYRDTQGRYDRLLVADGMFDGLSPCSPGQQKSLAAMVEKRPKRKPSTVQGAIDILNETLSEDQREQIAGSPQDDLIEYHFGLGLWIRNNFDLWSKNSKLLEAIGSANPDDASGILIERYWRSLQTPEPYRRWYQGGDSASDL